MSFIESSSRLFPGPYAECSFAPPVVAICRRRPSWRKDHSAVKRTAVLEDALVDLINRSDIVIDPFFGSGSTLVAADKTGRVCRGSSSTRSTST
jgi:DNA modification methylase